MLNRVETLNEALELAQSFNRKTIPKEIENNQEELKKLYGVTIVYAKNKIPDLTKKGTEGVQKDFELRSYEKGGIKLSDASTIFVPENKINSTKQKLQDSGLSHIEVRPSEELEVIRMLDVLDEK